MSFPPLAGGDHSILSSEFCSGYVDISGVWNTGFYCPQMGSTLAVYCCGTPNYKYCCTTKPENGTGAGIVEDMFSFTGGSSTAGGTTLGRPTTGITDNRGDLVTVDTVSGNDYSGATRMRPSLDDDLNSGFENTDLTSLNLSDVPIIFGVACGVAAVLILVILVGFYLTSCCAHYHQLAQNRKRRSSIPGIYRGVATTNTSTNSGLVNLYSPTHSAGTNAGGATPGSLPGSLVGGGAGILAAAENTQTYIVHHHHNNPPASPDSCTTSADHFQIGTSIVTSPLDIEWSSTTQYHQKPQHSSVSSSSVGQLQQSQASQALQPLNMLSNHVLADNRIHYTVHQTQNRLAVALTGSMNRLSDRASPCPNPASSSYPVNIPLTPPDGYSYPRQIPRGLSPPPQYSILGRAESPPYYPSYDNPSSAGSSIDHESSLLNQMHPHNYLSRTSTLPLSLSRKPPSGAGRVLVSSPSPYNSNLPTPQQPQPKSILRTSQNYRRVVTNETPPPIPPHNSSSNVFFGSGGPPYASGASMDGSAGGNGAIGGSSGNIAYRNVDSRTNLSNQPLLLLESKMDHSRQSMEDSQQGIEDEEDATGLHTATVIRRSSISAGVNASSVEEEEEEVEEEESRDHFDIHDIDSDALSRLIELDLDSKL